MARLGSAIPVLAGAQRALRPVALGLAFALVLVAPGRAEPARASASPRTAQDGAAPVAGASDAFPLVVWNVRIAEFRVPFEGRGPRERAERAAERILAVPADAGEWKITYQPESIGPQRAHLFTIDGDFAFHLFEGDIDGEAGETLDEAARAAQARLREVMDARYRQTRWPVVLRGLGIAAALTLAFAGALVGVARLRSAVVARIGSRLARFRMHAVVAGVNVWPILGGLRQVLAQLASWVVVGVLVFLWLMLVFEQFPYTEPWGNALGEFLVRVLVRLGWGILVAIPDLFVVLLIAALAHAFNRGVGAYFGAVERGEVTVSWLTSEVARATRQILALLTWAFALVLAYPYIPGSETAAFKGVTVFVGVIVSLGSAGLVNQVMGGLTVVYARAYRQGEYVRIGEQEGRVRKVGLLATTIEKPGGAVVAVPNAVVTANTITNFSRGSEGPCEVLVTSVAIGYDAPWRQVHALLEQAARRTPELAAEPPPSVLQRALSDFYVEYQLSARVADGRERAAALSRLHAEIQDAFNEAGVQIMVPHFEGQPARAVLVPRTSWFAPPAAGPTAAGPTGAGPPGAGPTGAGPRGAAS